MIMTKGDLKEEPQGGRFCNGVRWRKMVRGKRVL